MSYHEENELGRIRIGRGVVESVCASVIDSFDGRVIVSDQRGRMKHGGTRAADEGKGFARARVRDGKIDVKLYLITQFGASLRETAKSLAESIRVAFPAQAGIEVGLVTMVFVGVLSEKLSKRNVVFVDDGELREIVDEE